MKKDVTVSIVIPVFNKSQYTQNCLEALYKNTDNALDFEVIVVDNGSTDDTSIVLNNAASRFNRLRTLSNTKNLGFACACNMGAKKAEGKYILFLNNDTEPEPHWLYPMLEILEKDNSVGAVGCKLLYPDRTIQHAGVVFINDLRIGKTPDMIHIYSGCDETLPHANHIETYPAVSAACMTIPKKIFEKLNGFDENFWNGYEDVDLCLKIRRNRLKIVYQPQSVVIHHESKSGIERHLKSRKNYDYLQQKWANKLKPDYIRDNQGPFKLSKESCIGYYQIPGTSSQTRLKKIPHVLGLKFLPPEFISNQYFYLAESNPSNGPRSSEYFYKKALQYIDKVKEKNINHHYKIASINKRLKRSKPAIKGFETILNQSYNLELKAGAYFHLGELYLTLGDNHTAKSCFKNCLELNPQHQKAKSYMEKFL